MACGSGAANIAITTGNASGFSSVVSSPTAVVNFDSSTFLVSLKGAATAYILPNPSSVTLQGNNLAGTYLTNSSATTTYLQLSSAAVTYLTQSSATLTYFPSAGILSVAHGGTGTATPGLSAGTNIGSITGTWPNQTINASSTLATSTAAVSTGHCAQFSSATGIVDAGISCGATTISAGASRLQVTQSGVQITSPTSSMNFAGPPFSLSAAGTTAQININLGSDTQMLYNNAGSFAGSANIVTDGTNLTMPNGYLNVGITDTADLSNHNLGARFIQTPAIGFGLSFSDLSEVATLASSGINLLSLDMGPNTSGSFRIINSQISTTPALFIQTQQIGAIGIGTNAPDASSILDIRGTAIDGTTKLGMLPPRLSTTNRDSIGSPATGLELYNTTTNQNEFYNGVAWVYPILNSSALQSGTTFFVSSGTVNTLNVSSIRFPNGTIQVSSPSAGNFIQNTSSLQSGATFYVSSGTVAGTATGNNYPLTVSNPSNNINLGIGYTTAGAGSSVLNADHQFFINVAGSTVFIAKTSLDLAAQNNLLVGVGEVVGSNSSTPVNRLDVLGGGAASGGASIGFTGTPPSVPTNGLQVNGAVILSTVTASSGTVSTLNVTSIQFPNGTIQISSPSASGSSSSSGIVSPGTFTWTNNFGIRLSTASIGGTFPLLSTSTLQSGATIYASSGTVNQLNVSSLTVTNPVVSIYNGQNTGTLNGSFNLTSYPTKIQDVNGNYNGSTFTVPTAGYYYIDATTEISGTAGAGGAIQFSVYKNNVEICQAISRVDAALVGSNFPAHVNCVTKGDVGDTLAIWVNSSFTSPAYINAPPNQVLSIFKIF